MTHRSRIRFLGLTISLVCLLAAPMALRATSGWTLFEFLVAFAAGLGLLKQSFAGDKSPRWPQAVGGLVFAHMSWVCLKGGVSSLDEFSLFSITASALGLFLGCFSLVLTALLFSLADTKVSLDATSALPAQPLSWGLGLVAVFFGLSTLSTYDGLGYLWSGVAVGLIVAQMVFGAMLLKGRQIAPACFGLGLTSAGLSGLMVWTNSEIKLLTSLTGTQMAFYGMVGALTLVAFSVSCMIGAELALGSEKGRSSTRAAAQRLAG